MSSTTPIRSQPGIKRDGTEFDGDQYVDGLWVRFQRQLPRKIGGYRSVNKYLRGLVRTLNAYTLDLITYIHAGSANLVERLTIDGSFNTSVISDRTPATLTLDDRNMWQFDTITKGGEGLQIVAQVAPNLGCICNSEGGQLFSGPAFDTSLLTEITNLPAIYSATGGVLALHPYTLAFGNDGFVMWSTPGDNTDFTGTGSGSANITGQKLVRGMPLRGGPGASPSGLLWSADSLMRATYTGDATSAFQFDTISAQTSILSAQSVIEYDGIFYWLGSDRILSFNGVVREVPNETNLNFLFDNLNYQYRQKVFAYKVPRFGEIWWCFPFGESTEPNHAIIYNVRENCWYDTALPNEGRGAAASPAIFRKPIISGVQANLSDEQLRLTEAEDLRITEDGDFRETEDGEAARYRLWIHEQGVDEVDGLSVNPIQSYFETADICLPAQQQIEKAVQVLMLEPDFVQSGPLTVRVHGRANARAPEVEGPTMTIPETAAETNEQVVFLKEQRRQMRFRFESNCLGGDYQMGLVLAHLQPGDGTVLG